MLHGAAGTWRARPFQGRWTVGYLNAFGLFTVAGALALPLVLLVRRRPDRLPGASFRGGCPAPAGRPGEPVSAAGMHRHPSSTYVLDG